jgi:hypothetical protein
LTTQGAIKDPKPLTSRKRKPDVDLAGPDELFGGDLTRPVNRRGEREADRVAVQPARSKRVRFDCDPEEVDKMLSAPKKPRARRPAPLLKPLPNTGRVAVQPAISKPARLAIDPEDVGETPPAPKKSHTVHLTYQPLPNKPRPGRRWAISADHPETTTSRLLTAAPNQSAQRIHNEFMHNPFSRTAAPNRSDQENFNALAHLYRAEPRNPATSSVSTVSSRPKPQNETAFMEMYRVGAPQRSTFPATALLRRSTQQDRNAFQTKQGSRVKSSTSNALPPKQQHSDPRYAEIEPFEFKFIVSYAGNMGTEIKYHHSSDLVGEMEDFWSLLRKQLEQWEDAAGANWAWELQKTQKSRAHQGSRRRFCVTSKVAKRPTTWRKGDNGQYACRKCASNASLCFTWVADEEAKAAKDEDAGISAPKGEFWCLPVHPSDRRCEVSKGREIRTWLNEGDNSESDSSGEDDGAESDADEFKLELDFDSLVSESSTSEEENQDESDFDDGC